MSSYNTPILLIIFNRWDTTFRVAEKLRDIKPKKLYIAADGPRHWKEGEEEKCQKARSVTNLIDWDCEVKTLFQERNLGCGIGPLTAINWLFENEEYGVILEDDCLPNDSFFAFCEEILEKYKDDYRVMHVSGQNFLKGWQRDPDYSYYFSTGIEHCWGWATWRRAWRLYDYHISNFPEVYEKGYLKPSFVNEAEYRYFMWKYKRLYENTNNRDVWDYQWGFIIHSNSGLCVIPEKNMVKNIGFRADATHTLNEYHTEGEMGVEEMDFPLRHPEFVVRDVQSDQKFFNLFWKDKLISKAKHLYHNSLGRVVNPKR